MPNVVAALKAEISRIARKEVRADIANLRRTVSKLRSDIAALKRAGKSAPAKSAHAVREVLDRNKGHLPAGFRFSAKGLTAQRERLGLSARECGLLLGATAQSIYNWEEGKIRPRDKHLVAIAAMRKLGRREARRHLDLLA